MRSTITKLEQKKSWYIGSKNYYNNEIKVCIQSVLERIIEFHQRSLVSTTIAVVRRRKYSDHVSILTPIVPLEYVKTIKTINSNSSFVFNKILKNNHFNNRL